MPVNIISGIDVSVAGGPKLKIGQAIPVEAYDYVDIAVVDGAADQVVEIQPSTGSGQVQFLLVSASQYAPALSYKVNAAANPPNDLDRPLLLAGSGAIGLLGAAPESLVFSNATGADINVQIIVGRDATP